MLPRYLVITDTSTGFLKEVSLSLISSPWERLGGEKEVPLDDIAQLQEEFLILVQTDDECITALTTKEEVDILPGLVVGNGSGRDRALAMVDIPQEVEDIF